MIKLLPYFFVFFVSVNSSAQTKSSDSLKMSINSLKDDELIKMIDSIEPPSRSRLKVAVGIGNKLFSVSNNSLNASQANVNQLFYTPALTYLHKSGVSIGLSPFITSQNGALKVYQTALSTAYDYDNDAISTGVSYTHYFSDSKSYSNNSIFQHDFYSYIQYTKSYIIPVFSIGYSAGTYREINSYTTPNNRIILDSTQNSVRNFTASAGVEHSFFAKNIFSKKDGFSFTPQVLLIVGSDHSTTTHLNKIDPALIKKIKKVRTRNQTSSTSTSNTQTTRNALALQSLALSLDATYNFGKFFLSPNIFSNYYLPKTTENRLSTVFSVHVGFIF